jgi:glycosyltransferase involved in cell wall biosynthesis
MLASLGVMRVLAITKIFPNSLEPLSAAFNRQQFAELAKLCELEVLEAIPWVPGAGVTNVPARAARLASLPAREVVAGIETTYMRQLYLPRVGLAVAVPLYFASLAPHRRLARACDVVLATWAYPDGCAATLMARALGKPCVVKVHGTDVNVVARRLTARAVLRRVLPRADGVVAVSRSLAESVERIGVDAERVHVVANGVDAELFAVRDREEARRALGLPAKRPMVLFVGRIEPQKGVGELVDAFERVRARVPGAMLALVGDGVSARDVRGRAAAWGDALVVPGPRPHEEVARWLAACDVFTLPSHGEGMPNVVLEALACGRPAVATRVGGIPEVLSDARAGMLVPPCDAAALADALVAALGRKWDAADVRACGPWTWRESARALRDVLDAARRIRPAA